MTMTTAELDAERIFRTELFRLGNETKRRLIELLASSLTFSKTKKEEIMENLQVERIHPIEKLDPRVQQLVGVVHLGKENVGLDGEIRKAEYLEKE